MADFEALLESSGAVLHGHFVLTSGRHSAVYFEKFRILEQPKVLTPLCSEIANRFAGEVELVAGPTTGGVIMAFEVARQLGVPAVYIETENGRKTLRRGATIPPGAKVLVVDDVLTTGLSVQESLSAVRDSRGEPVGVAVLIDRSEGGLDFGVPSFAVHKVAAESYSAEEIPAWLQDVPVTKPGTRSLAGH